MATQTPNLNLVLPDYTDKADVGVINDNFKKIDNFSGGGKVDEWLSDIQEKADESLSKISQDATSYLNSIQNEATESLKEIDTKAKEVFDSIPDDYERIAADVSALKGTKADKEDCGITTTGPVSPTIRNAGYFVNNQGRQVANAAFNVFEAVNLSEGDRIKIYAKGYMKNVAILSKTSETQETYTPVVLSTDSTAHIYTYTVELAGWYAICSENVVNVTYEIVTNAIANSVNELKRSIDNLDGSVLAMFDTLVCIGDSLTWSQVYTAADASRQAFQPYPKMLEKRTGTPTEYYAQPGATPTSWWSLFGAECLTSRKNACYIVYLGTNGDLTDTVSEDCPDGVESSEWANTHTAYYGRILNAISNLGARAILVKVYAGSSAAKIQITNSVIEQFGTRFGFPVVDNQKLKDAVYHYYPDKSGMNDVHYNDVGYATFANQLLKNIAAFSIDQLAMLIPN